MRLPAFPISSVRLFTHTVSDMDEHCSKTNIAYHKQKAMSVQSRHSVRESSEHRIWKRRMPYSGAVPSVRLISPYSEPGSSKQTKAPP